MRLSRVGVVGGAAAVAALASFMFPVVAPSALPADPSTPVGSCAGLSFSENGSCTVAPGETVQFLVVSGSGGNGGRGGDGGDAYVATDQSITPATTPSWEGTEGGPGGVGGRGYMATGSYTNDTGSVVTLYAQVGANGANGEPGAHGFIGTSNYPNGGDGQDGFPGFHGQSSAIYLDNPFVLNEVPMILLNAVVVVSGGERGEGGPGGEGGEGQQLLNVNLLDGVDGSIEVLIGAGVRATDGG